MATVLYPGSFDPIHLGHLDIIEQAVALFGRVVVVVMHNHEKATGLFDVDHRIELIRRSIFDDGTATPDDIDVIAHAGLAVDAAAVAGADFIVKGLRSSADFEIEQQMALTNHSVTGIRTVYLPCAADRGFISSRFVREIARYGGSVDHLVPGPVADALARSFPTDDTTR